MNGIKVHAINCNIAARGESSYSERDRKGEKRWKYAEWEIKWVTITGKHDSIINVQQAGGQ